MRAVKKITLWIFAVVGTGYLLSGCGTLAVKPKEVEGLDPAVFHHRAGDKDYDPKCIATGAQGADEPKCTMVVPITLSMVTGTQKGVKDDFCVAKLPPTLHFGDAHREFGPGPLRVIWQLQIDPETGRGLGENNVSFFWWNPIHVIYDPALNVQVDAPRFDVGQLESDFPAPDKVIKTVGATKRLNAPLMPPLPADVTDKLPKALRALAQQLSGSGQLSVYVPMILWNKGGNADDIRVCGSGDPKMEN